MSMVEQKFSALDSFAGTYRIEFYMYAGQYSITVNLHWSTGRHETADDAMTQALRYLRRINKTPKP